MIAAGIVLVVVAEYTYDEDEKFLEQYRPGCRDAGAYVRAKDAIRSLERSLKNDASDIDLLAARALKVGS